MEFLLENLPKYCIAELQFHVILRFFFSLNSIINKDQIRNSKFERVLTNIWETDFNFIKVLF